MLGSYFYADFENDLTRYLGGLTCTQGIHAGKPFKLLDWQYEFMWEGFCDENIQNVYLTIARGNGKTTLLAGVALAAIDGPLMQPNAETVIVAASLDQAKILFKHVLAFGGSKLRNKKKFRLIDNDQRCAITNRDTGASLKAIGSDPKRAHGLAPLLVLADEPAQWVSGGDAMFAALRTSLGKITGSKFVGLGTRSAVPEHWFSRRLTAKSDSTYVQFHAVLDPEDVHDEKAWHKANPSLSHMPDLEKTIRNEAKEADSDPGLKAQFHALRLNAGVSDVENRDMLVHPALWKECLTSDPPPREGQPVWGLDLGGGEAMSAIAACWPNGRLETLSMFGKDPDLVRRALQDNVGDLYAICQREGDLLVSPKRIPDVPALFERAENRWGGMPSAIIADRWRASDLKDSLESVPQWFRVPLILRGQGYKDGASAVRAWRKAVVNRKIRAVAPARLLTSSLAEAVTLADPAGNEKLAKNTEGGRRKRARDDVVAASLLAVEYGMRDVVAQEDEGHGGYGGLV